uniref:Thioredoxin-fold protein n=1 Tax=Pithovirus LCPAC201 TaxID=2506591 RepID=A0A481Z5R6_9VIRU|nr:MAG: thioredoxin-fold protein [Pithovirus LCPAC201]
MSNLSIATLVIVTAQNCGGCAYYKRKTEANLHSAIKLYSNNRKSRGVGGIDVINISLESTRSPSSSILDRYHPDLKSYVGWFPTFLLFSDKRWKNKDIKLEGLVYNGVNRNGRWELSKSPTSTDQSHIMGWIKNSITQNSLFLENTIISQGSTSINPSSRLMPIMSDSSTGRLQVLPVPQYSGNLGSYSKPISKIKFGAPISEEYTGDRSW